MERGTTGAMLAHGAVVVAESVDPPGGRSCRAPGASRNRLTDPEGPAMAPVIETDKLTKCYLARGASTASR